LREERTEIHAIKRPKVFYYIKVTHADIREGGGRATPPPKKEKSFSTTTVASARKGRGPIKKGGVFPERGRGAQKSKAWGKKVQLTIRKKIGHRQSLCLSRTKKGKRKGKEIDNPGGKGGQQRDRPIGKKRRKGKKGHYHASALKNTTRGKKGGGNAERKKKKKEGKALPFTSERKKKRYLPGLRGDQERKGSAGSHSFFRSTERIHCDEQRACSLMKGGSNPATGIVGKKPIGPLKEKKKKGGGEVPDMGEEDSDGRGGNAKKKDVPIQIRKRHAPSKIAWGTKMIHAAKTLGKGRKKSEVPLPGRGGLNYSEEFKEKEHFAT